MSARTTDRPERRTSVPRALGLFAGTIGFVAAIVVGMSGGGPPAATVYRATACGIALAALAFLAGAVGVQVVKESQAREKASVTPPPAAGAAPPAASVAPAPGTSKSAPPAAPGEAGAAGGARPRSAAKAGAAPASR